ncbi:MAG: retropepsin-like aspartic protease [Pseudomonadota bacterium]
MLRIILSLAIASGLSPSALAEHRIPLERDGNGAFSVLASVGEGQPTEFLVDTGSSFVVLSPSTFRAAERYGELKTVREIRGAMADGKVVRATLYSIPSLTLGNACQLKDVEAVVLPGATKDIIGLSALMQLGSFAMRFDPPALSFSQCQTAEQPLPAGETPVSIAHAVPP